MNRFAPLTPYPRALELIREAIKPLDSELLPLNAINGRYLAKPVKARFASPRFANSSMDGFAVRTADLSVAGPKAPVSLQIIGEIPAGSDRILTLKAGQAVRVFTGGRLPLGADAVAMVEIVEDHGDCAVLRGTVPRGNHIRPVGSEYRRGDVILPLGMKVTPPVIGVLASFGLSEVVVGRAPRVTVITMGEELAPADSALATGQIHDANGPALLAALHAQGVAKAWVRRVGDRPSALKGSLAAAIARSDLVITVGGASVGDHDHARAVRDALGIRERYTRLAVKPGKPSMFGLAPGGVPVFGLPGNPVSALVGFHQLVRPALRLMMGGGFAPPRSLPIALGNPIPRARLRTEWLRGNLVVRDGALVARPGGKQESHMLSGLAGADVLIEIPVGQGDLSREDSLTVYPLDWQD